MNEERPQSKTERTVRRYLANITHHIKNALNDQVRLSQPDYSQTLEEAANRCNTLMDEAFKSKDESDAAKKFDQLAAQIVALEKLMEDPPDYFPLKTDMVLAACQEVRRTLAQRHQKTEEVKIKPPSDARAKHPPTPMEEKVRKLFATVVQQVDQALTEEVRQSFPAYAAEVNLTISQCDALLDEAFIYQPKDDKTQLSWLDNFANRMVVLEKLLDDPTPGAAFNINHDVIDAAFRGIRNTLIQRYEVYFPRDDNEGPLLDH